MLGLNAWAAGWPWSHRRIVNWSSYIVLTEPIPDRLAELGWTGGEGLCDARFTLHYLRTTPDGRIALGGGGGRAGWGGRVGAVVSPHDAGSARLAAVGLRRLFPSLADVRIEDAWGGPIDICDDHRPFFGSAARGTRSTTATATAATASDRPTSAAGSWRPSRSVAATSPSWTCRSSVAGHAGFRPIRSGRSGHAIVRDAIVRREQAEEAGRPASRVDRELSRLPARFGYRLGMH